MFLLSDGAPQSSLNNPSEWFVFLLLSWDQSSLSRSQTRERERCSADLLSSSALTCEAQVGCSNYIHELLLTSQSCKHTHTTYCIRNEMMLKHTVWVVGLYMKPHAKVSRVSFLNTKSHVIHSSVYFWWDSHRVWKNSRTNTHVDMYAYIHADFPRKVCPSRHWVTRWTRADQTTGVNAT